MIHSVVSHGVKYQVDFTTHTKETRASENVSRDALVYPSLCTELLKKALQYGLFSLRNKTVAITARVGDNFAVSFLVKLDDNNKIVVISILVHPINFYGIYIKVRNRINLYSLVFPEVSVSEAYKLRSINTAAKKPKSFKRKNVPQQKYDYDKGSKSQLKNDLDTYTTTHNYKRTL